MTHYGFPPQGPGLQVVRCAGERCGEPCHRILFEAPLEWGEVRVYTLTARDVASGRGIVKHCPGCRAWVEIRFERWRAVA